MFNDWHREGDFYQRNTSNHYLVNSVVFRNNGQIVSIKKIEVCCYKDGIIRIYLYPSEFVKVEIADVCRKYFVEISKIECDLFGKQITVELSSKKNLMADLDVFKKMFNYLNSKYSRIEFSKEITDELTSILLYLSSSKTSSLKFKHIIKEFINEPTHVNPIRKKSTALLDSYYYKSKKDIDDSPIEELHAWLRLGEDPNQCDETGNMLGEILILHKDEKWVALAMKYGFDPNRRPSKGCIFDDNAFDLMKKYNKVKHFKVVMLAYSRPEKAIAKPNVEVRELKTFSLNGQIITNMTFTDDQKITARLITTENFHKLESESVKLSLFDLFSKLFGDSKGRADKTKTNFEMEFSPEKNKWIELYFDSVDRFIGFNLTRVVMVNGNIVSKSEYMGVDPNSMLRSCGACVIFGERASLAIKSLYKNMNVILYYLATHYNSFRSHESELNSTNFFSNYLLALAQKLLNDEFYRPVIIRNGCFIEEDGLLRVKEKKSINPKEYSDDFYFNEFSKGIISLGEYFFYAFILQYKSEQDKALPRAAIVCSIVDSGFSKRRAERARKLNIDLRKNVYELAKSLESNLSSFLPQFSQYRTSIVRPDNILAFSDERLLFWTGTALRSKL